MTLFEYLELIGETLEKTETGWHYPGSLFLEGTGITTIPENLTVGGNVYADWENIQNYPFVSGCGDQNRTIYLQPGNWNLINIGCFRGTKEEAIQAIRGIPPVDPMSKDLRRYSGEAMEIYIQQVEACFQKGGK